MSEQQPDDFLADELSEIGEGSDEQQQQETNGSADGFLDDAIEEPVVVDGFLEGIDEKPEVGKAEGIDYQPDIHFHSSEDMHELEDESVHLAVTSPPYNAGWAYGSVDDDLDYHDEYLPMLAEVFTEVHRVLVPGGRLVVNVPSLLRAGQDGGRPIAADISVMMDTSNDGLMLSYPQDQSSIAKLRIQTDWVMREWITWDKGFNTDGLAPNGSFPRPWGILLNNMHEVCMVFQKPGDREYDDMSEKIIEESKINKWSDDLCDDVWKIHPDSWTFKYIDGEDVPPFPEELVKRCIALWSYKDDTVLDPFGGRGTTGKVAKMMERESVLYEIRDDLKKDMYEYIGMNQQTLW